MLSGSMKADPMRMIQAHRHTYVDARTGRSRWQDYALLEVAPLVVFVVSLVGNVHFGSAVGVGLLTVSGLLSVFLFSVMLQVSERAMEWADSLPQPGPDTSAHAIYLAELAANAGYASLISILAAVAFVVASVSEDWVLRISSTVGLALGVHLLLILLMVMKRVYALTEERLNRARTGADRRGS